MSEKKQENIDKLAELTADIHIAMLTTADESGNLFSRPMATLKREFDGKIYFFTKTDSAKIAEIAADRQVGLSYADERAQTYVSMSGIAKTTQNREQMKELWSPAMKAWFPEGLDDPQLALLEITVDKAEYWDSVSSRIVQLFEMTRAVLTGTEANLGENKKVDVEAATK